MTGRPLFNVPGIVLLLLNHLPGTSTGLLRQARALEISFSSRSLDRAIDQLKTDGLITFAGNAGHRGGGKRYVLTEAGHEIASDHRRLLAVAASNFPDESA